MNSVPTNLAVVWRPRAQKDLLAIIRYIGQDNPLRAESFGKELRAKTKSLESHPLLGRIGQAKNTRELVVHPNYLLIYRVLGNVVDVLRVKHAAQQQPLS